MEKLSEMIVPSQSTKDIHSNISGEEMVFITKHAQSLFSHWINRTVKSLSLVSNV